LSTRSAGPHWIGRNLLAFLHCQLADKKFRVSVKTKPLYYRKGAEDAKKPIDEFLFFPICVSSVVKFIPFIPACYPLGASQRGEWVFSSPPLEERIKVRRD